MGFSHRIGTVSKFMDDLNSACFFFADSRKKKFFERFINSYNNERLTIVVHLKFFRHVTSILKTVKVETMMVSRP